VPPARQERGSRPERTTGAFWARSGSRGGLNEGRGIAHMCGPLLGLLSSGPRQYRDSSERYGHLSWGVVMGSRDGES
jgi:hypothetical protein